MSTPDQPESTPLTRRRLREIRATGANPVITADQVAAAEAAAAEQAAEEADAATDAPARVEDAPGDTAADADAPAEPAPEPAVPLPRPAEPIIVGPPPADVDLGVAPLTRRQARAQERIRTASVPIIQPDAIPRGGEAEIPSVAGPFAPAASPESEAGRGDAAETRSEASVGVPDAVPVETETVAEGAVDAAAHEEDAAPAQQADEPLAVFAEADESSDRDDEPEQLVVNPELGSELLAGEAPAVSMPPSFDSLISRGSSTTGSIAASNALILSQTPTATPLGPINATGEILITGSFDLPEGFGSAGSAHGTTDGKDVDATLIDGELPPASSPTPIAASAAISTARHSGEEIIRPPAPEKGNRLMLALVVTAGVLALAVVGVLIFAVTTGVF